jgi:uncharacterized protein HemX
MESGLAAVVAALITATGLILAAYITRQVQQARRAAGRAARAATDVDETTDALLRALEESALGRSNCEKKMAELQLAHARLQTKHEALQRDLDLLRRKVEERNG